MPRKLSPLHPYKRDKTILYCSYHQSFSMYKARGILSKSSRIPDKLKNFIKPKFPRVIFLEF